MVGDIAIKVETEATFCVRMMGWERLDDDLPGLEALRNAAGMAHPGPVQLSNEDEPRFGFC